MHLIETVLYAVSIVFVIAYVAFLAVMLVWDKGRRTLTLALRSLWLHKLRAMLSVLGIIIGTGAVIALMGFGEGSMQDALDDIKRMGATNIIVRSVKPPDEMGSQRSYVARYGLTTLDYDRIDTIPTITRIVPMRIFPKAVYNGPLMHNCRIVATTPEYKDVNQLEEDVGRFIVDQDDEDKVNVAILGSNAAAKLFPLESPLNQTIMIDKFDYYIVGVLKERMPTGGTGGSQAAEDFNNDVYLPMHTFQGRFGKRVFLRTAGSRQGEEVEFSQLTLTVSDIDHVRATGEAVREVLLKHQKEDWAITVPLDRLEEAERAKNRYTLLLALIASISLIVGGIGIMNIMLATVTERTREIGIRRALGAKRRDITLQFLVEAIVQTSVGGLFGVLMGLGVVLLVPWAAELFEFKLPAKVHVLSIFLSLAAAVGVGVFFGLYPARRAAFLDPIEALRHE